MSDPVTIIIYSSDHAIYKPDCLTSICAYVFLKTIPGKGFFLKIYGHSILKNEQGQVRMPLRCSVFFFFFFLKSVLCCLGGPSMEQWSEAKQLVSLKKK